MAAVRSAASRTLENRNWISPSIFWGLKEFLEKPIVKLPLVNWVPRSGTNGEGVSIEELDV